MNNRQLPSVELIQGSPSPTPAGPARRRRWKVFFSVLIVALAIGLAVVYGRSPVYRAVASVLTVKPKAVDTRSAEADVEHVVIQGRLLLGDELLGRLAGLLATEGDTDIADRDRLRGMLGVVPVPETNLLELRADGEDPDRLTRVVNRWAESYETFRVEQIATATGRTTAELEDQQAQIEARIDAARGALQAFREANDIVSLERGENRSLARLKGLNEALNKARERQVETEARLLAVEAAITDGDTVIPNEQKAEIAKMQLAVQRLRAHLAELRQRYTQRYIDRDPALKALPGELRAMESELAHALTLAKTTVRDEARQEAEAARASVAVLERELDEHQASVQQFTERFKEFKALEENLARLELIRTDNDERLAQIQVRNFRKFPPIQVVEWARVPSTPIYPDYDRDLMIAIAAALGLALFATWLVEYLSERPADHPASPYLGVRVYQEGAERSLAAQADPRLVQAPAPDATSSPPPDLPVLPRELAGTEVKSLLAVADPETAAFAALLLSGVTPYELPLLHGKCFDDHSRRLRVPGAQQRELTFDAATWQRLAAARGGLDGTSMALPVAELDGRLRQAATDIPLGDPASVSALSLWHTYVLYLVRQGIEFDVLTAQVGALPAEMRDTLMHFMPPGGVRPAERIDFTYPALLA